MCGICGQFNFKENIPVESETIKRMTATMIHRGPDDHGMHISGPLGLGFRRLSIIDLAGGHQPMSDQEQSVWVVFNGEIYNFPELKKELEQHGHVFQTKSDTEVIIHGYKQWGLEVLDHLNGMFGFAIWDEQRKRLVIARDRMGIKLVYYKINAGRLVFGSEIRALRAGDETIPEVDTVALNLFLRYRYTPSPLTIFKGIKKLAPGTCLIAEKGSVRFKRWWNFKPVPFDPMPSAKQAQGDLLDLYQRAVKRQLISDVPLGLFLSGGLDSGLLLALMNRNGSSWKTFTVGYGKAFREDELSQAAETAKILQAHHIPIKLNHETFEESLPKIIAHLEEPVASSSIVPMYHVSECARQHVKVALMGQGPDELFGGYIRHLGVHYGACWRQLPAWLHSTLNSVLSLLPRAEFVKRGLYSLNVPGRMHRYQQVFSIVPGAVIDNLFQDGLIPPCSGDRVLDFWQDLEPLLSKTDELGGLNFLEIRSSLPDELLMYADKLSMAHGLEVRVPYLDQEIVEYVERLSASFKIHNGNRKWLHRKVCQEYLPKKILQRKKVGFAVNVVDDWFRESLAKRSDNILLDKNSLMFNYLIPDAVAHLLSNHKSGRHDNHKILFSLVAFEVWLRSFH